MALQSRSLICAIDNAPINYESTEIKRKLNMKSEIKMRYTEARLTFGCLLITDTQRLTLECVNVIFYSHYDSGLSASCVRFKCNWLEGGEVHKDVQ